MAKYTGANKQQQVELKRLHAKKVSAADAAKLTSIDKKCVDSFYKHFDDTKPATSTKTETTEKK